MASLDVKVKIELSKVAGSVGFGIPLLLEGGAAKEVAYTECYSIEDVVTAGYTETTATYKAANMIFAQEHRPAKIAVCGVAGTVVETLPTLIAKDFRYLIVVGGSADDYVAIADYIETTKKMFFVSMSAEDFKTFKTKLTGKKYDRTVIFVNGTANADAALVGEIAGRVAGSFTYKFKTLKGVAPETFTDAELEEIHKAGAFAYVTKAGDDVTTEGISQSGTYIDQTDSIDYVIANVEYKVQKTLNSNDKVGYTDKGISLIEAAVTSVLQDAGNIGIIAEKEDGTYDYSVSFAPRSATTEAERASRIYKYGTFKFSLAGAIHDVEVHGEITA